MFMPIEVSSVAAIRLPVPFTKPRIEAANRWRHRVVSITAPNIIAERISQTVGSMLAMPPRDSSASIASLPDCRL